jgi:uncharacterized spore protein YtfJ
MTDEMDLTPDFETLESSAQAVDAVQETLEMFLETASVDRVYGEPIQHGDTLIIPAAEVLAGLGFGMGYGYGSGRDEEAQQKQGSGGGGGGGGGGRTFSRPVAVIVASSEGVRVQEVVDPTKIALAALTAAGFMAGMLMRMLKPRRSMGDLTAE